MSFGLDSTGFNQKRVADILASIEAAEELSFGASLLDKVSTSIIAQLNGVFAGELASAWQLAQDVYASQYPSTAGGTSLALLGLLTGASPLAATQSWCFLVGIGTNGTAIPVNNLFATASTGAPFLAKTAATIATLSAWAPTTAYSAQSGATVGVAVAGSLVTNDSGKIYYCTQSGTSAGSGGPTGTGTGIVDGTCAWNYVGAGAAAVAFPAVSSAFDAITAAAYDLTVITTAVSGLTSVTNPLAAALGYQAETDAAFRIRRAGLIRQSGNGTAAAIQSKILALSGVTQCVVVNNPTGATVSGQPAYSFAPYVVGGADQDIWDAIVQSQPAGIQSYGSSVGTGADVNGNAQYAAFSRPTTVPIYIAITLTSGSGYTGAASVKTAVAAFANAAFAAGFGGTVVANKFYAPAYNGYLQNLVAGVSEITALNIGTAPSPASAADIPIGSTSLASFATADITVNGS